MAHKPITSVVLTPESREMLKSDDIRLFLKDGSYFNCKSVEQDGYFLVMTIEVPHSKAKNLNAVLSIPLHFVLYAVSGEATRKALGFSND